MKHKQTKQTDISRKVKQAVWKRDGHRCIVCGNPCAMPNAHVFYNRSHGGLGVEQNVATLCQHCHHLYDNGKKADHERIKAVIYNYMFKHYPNLDIETLKARNKWE